MPITVRDVRAFKERGERFAMLTAYDAHSARLLDEAGIPLILVGDTLGMVMLGHPTTLPVTMEDMLHHTSAVVRGRRDALVVGDMPFMSYQGSTEDGIRNAGRFLKEAGADAVKLEGGDRVVDLVARLTDAGIPVMGHLGLTPQSVNQFGGYRVQGRSEEAAHQIVADAKALQSAGIFALVLEAVPSAVAKQVTESLAVPTIGIGAGPDTDGQVLVWHDFLGITDGKLPRFVKRYANLGEEIKQAAAEFRKEVAEGVYPAPEHTYE
ncbi:MAG: 3-methyl-2-oxobutanoate hydroxymethyltransferase [Actinomycetota bacterium]|jgi:3-methyl-2-oxobutanoate hydroxymethyltransferase|nr:3-methyl-2-oxobutanoate hydroxymethyltransferase [Actinomycetota bacterium]